MNNVYEVSENLEDLVTVNLECRAMGISYACQGVATVSCTVVYVTCTLHPT